MGIQYYCANQNYYSSLYIHKIASQCNQILQHVHKILSESGYENELHAPRLSKTDNGAVIICK